MCLSVCVSRAQKKRKKKSRYQPRCMLPLLQRRQLSCCRRTHTPTQSTPVRTAAAAQNLKKKKTAASAATTNCKGQKNPKYTTMCSKTRCNRRRAKGGSEGVDSSTHCHRKRGNRRADDAQPKKPNEFCLFLYVCVCVRARKCVRFCVCECVRSFFCNFNLLLLFTSGGWVEGTE